MNKKLKIKRFVSPKDYRKARDGVRLVESKEYYPILEFNNNLRAPKGKLTNKINNFSSRFSDEEKKEEIKMKEEKKDLTHRIVSQNSELGSLGLAVLSERGFCGPPYDLSDFAIHIYRIKNGFEVSFYDMDCYVGESNKYYSEMKELFERVKSQK